jgi:type I restriction enzyme M protein
MLSVAEKYIRDLNADAQPAALRPGLERRSLGGLQVRHAHQGRGRRQHHPRRHLHQGRLRPRRRRQEVDLRLHAGQPALRRGVEAAAEIHRERARHALASAGASARALPRINDGALLFLQHMLSKMRPRRTAAAASASSSTARRSSPATPAAARANIRRWIIENDWLEAIVALPDQLFYNTGISTYVWVSPTARSQSAQGQGAAHRRPPLLGADGEKPRQQAPPHRRSADKAKDPTTSARSPASSANFRTARRAPFTEEDPVTKSRELVVSKVFDNEDFGYHKITVERPLRLNFQATAERIARLDDETGFKNLATSSKKNETVRQQEIEAGKQRQEEIRDLLRAFAEARRHLVQGSQGLPHRLREFDRARGSCA